MPKVDRRSKLAELRAARSAGKKIFDTYKVGDAEELYEEVDEDGYKKIVRDRLDEDDFVVDDNGEGYADDGREEWDRPGQGQYESESDEDLPGRGRPSKAGMSPSLSRGHPFLRPPLTPCSQEAKGRRQGEARCQRP